jgi:hypothetical protein
MYPNATADRFILITALVPYQSLDALQHNEQMMRKVEFFKTTLAFRQDENDDWRDNEFLQVVRAIAVEGKKLAQYVRRLLQSSSLLFHILTDSNKDAFKIDSGDYVPMLIISVLLANIIEPIIP